MESTMDVGGAAIESKLMRAAALLDTDPSRAAREAAQILKHHPGQVALALADRRYGAAEELLRRRLAAEPQDVAAMRMLAALAAEREDYIEAERLYGACLKLAPGYSRARFELARILLLQQKADPILPLAERLLELEPDNLRYNTLQAAAYTLLGQNQPAIDVLSALVAQSPRNEALWLAIGASLPPAGGLAAALPAF